MTPLRVDAAPTSAWAASTIWDREYRDVRSIPSSHRAEPSHALTRLLGPAGDLRGTRVLDAGCGTGRNARALALRGAEVMAVDGSSEACRFARAAVPASMPGSLQVVQTTFAVDNVPAGPFDLVLDAYVGCHLASVDDFQVYLRALIDQLVPSGRLYTSVLGADDEFYRSCVDDHDNRLATDPSNGITKRLYDIDEFETLLSRLGTAKTVVECFDDEVRGRTYRREILAGLIFR